MVRHPAEEASIREPTSLSQQRGPDGQRHLMTRKQGPWKGMRRCYLCVCSLSDQRLPVIVCCFQCRRQRERAWGWNHLCCLFRCKTLVLWATDLVKRTGGTCFACSLSNRLQASKNQPLVIKSALSATQKIRITTQINLLPNKESDAKINMREQPDGSV